VALLLVIAFVLGMHTGGARPHVYVADESPFVVRGTGFRGSERVTIVVDARNHVQKKVTATTTGGFLARMPAVKLGSCSSIAVRATGSEGSRARMKITSECANLAPAGQ
jgi:hypothetical protein